MRCEGCGRQLAQYEGVLCDACYERHLETCLLSAHWMRVRGPYVAAEFERELAAIRAKKAYAAIELPENVQKPRGES